MFLLLVDEYRLLSLTNINCHHNITEWLYHEGNDLTRTLSRDIYNMTSLEELRIYNNALSGTLSPNIMTPINLEELDLPDNSFGGVIPSEIGKLHILSQCI